MEWIFTVAIFVCALSIGVLIFILGFNDYKQRRDRIEKSAKDCNAVFDWLKQQPDDVKRKFLDDYDAIQAGKKRG